jgi:hypothetical protein
LAAEGAKTLPVHCGRGGKDGWIRLTEYLRTQGAENQSAWKPA